MTVVILDWLLFGKGSISQRVFPSDGYELFLRGFGSLVAGISGTLIWRWAIAQNRNSNSRERSSAALREIGRIANSSLDLDKIHDELFRQIALVIPSDRIAITLIDISSGSLIVRHEWGSDMEGREQGSRSPLVGSLAEHVAGTGEAVIWPSDRATNSLVNGITALSENIKKQGVKTLLMVPLVSGHDTFGVMLLHRISGEIFARSDRDVALAVGAQIAGAISNSELHHQTAKLSEQNAILAEIGRIANSSLEINEVFERVGVQIRQLIPADRVSISQVDTERGTFTVPYRWGRFVPGRDDVLEHSLEDSFLGHVIESGQSTRWPTNSDGLPDSFSGWQLMVSAGISSAIVVPLVTRTGLNFGLMVGNFSGVKFSDTDLELTEAVAVQITGAVGNSEMHSQLDRRAHEDAVLAQIGRVVSSSPVIDDVYANLAELITQLIPADHISFLQMDESATTFRVRHSWGMDINGRNPGSIHELEGTLGAHVAKTGKSVLIGSTDAEPLIRERFPTLAPVLDAGIRSIVSCPLVSNGKLMGTFHVNSRTPGAFGQSHLELLNRIAAQIGGPIANAELNAEVDRRAREESTLAEIGRVSSSTLSIEEVFVELAELIADLIPVERISTDTVDIDSGTFTVRHTWGLDVAARRKQNELPLAGHLSGETVRLGRSVLINNTDEEPDILERLPGLEPGISSGFRTFLSVPMVFRDRVTGVFALRSSVPYAFSERHQKIAERIADQISGTVVNSQVREQAEDEAEREATLAEIGRLASVPHDPTEMFRSLAEPLARLFPFDRFAITTFDRETEMWTTRSTSGQPVPGYGEGDQHENQDDYATWLIEHGPQIIDSRDAPDSVNVWLGGTQFGALVSALIIPLVTDGELFGNIGLRSCSYGVYNDGHVALAKRLSNQINGAVATIAFHARLDKIAREESILAELGRIIGSSLVIEDSYALFVEQALKLVPADRLALTTVDSYSGTWTTRHLWGIETHGRDIGSSGPLKGSISGEVIKKNRVVVLSARQIPCQLDEAGLKSAIAVPLISDNWIIGTLQFQSTTPDAYTAEHARVADKIGSQIAGAIANSDLHSQAERQAREEKYLADIGRMVSSSLDFEEMFEAISTPFGLLIPYDRLSVNTYEHENGVWTTRYTKGVEVTGFSVGDRRNDSDLYEQMMTTNRAVLLDGSESDSNPQINSAQAQGLFSALQIPLKVNGETIGSISARSRDNNAYGMYELMLGERIADQIASAVMNSDLHALTAQQAVERSVLAEIGRLISSSLDIDSLYPTVVELIRSIIQADRITIDTFDIPEHTWAKKYVWGIEIEGRRVGDSGTLDGSAGAMVSSLRGPLLINGIDAEDDRYTGLSESAESGLKSAIVAPLIARDSVIGAIHIQSTRPTAYGSSQADLTQRVADQIAGAVANAGLHTQVDRRADEEEILAEIGRITSSTFDLGEVYAAVAESTQALVSFDHMTALHIDEARSEFFVAYTMGEGESDMPVGTTSPMSGSLVEHLTETRQSLLVDAAELEELSRRFSGMRDTYQKYGYPNRILVPLLTDDRVVAVLVFVAQDPNAMGAQELAFAERMGRQIAGAVVNADLHGQVDRQAHIEAILAEIGRQISATPDIHDTLAKVATQITELIPFDRMTVYGIDPGQQKGIVTYASGVAIPGFNTGDVRSLSGTLAENCCETKKSILFVEQDSEEMMNRFPKIRKSVETYGFSSRMGIPLIRNDKVFALLSLWAHGQNAYGAPELELAERIGSQLAGAVANAGLRSRLDRRAQEETILADIGRTISSTLDVDEVYKTVATRIRELLPFELMTSVDIDHELDELTVAFTSGLENSDWIPGITRPLGGTLAEDICDKRQALLLHGDDIQITADKFSSATDDSEQYGYGSGIFVPLVHDGKVISIVGFYAQDETAFGDRELALAKRIGAQISGTVASSRLYLEVSRAWTELDVRAVAMETAADMIVITDRDGTIEYVNQAFVNTTGYSKDEAVGQNPRILASGQHETDFYKDLWGTVLDGRSWTGTLINRRKDGSEYPDRMTITPVLGDAGEITRFIAIKRDITAQIEAEQERELRRELDSENRELQRGNEARIQFLSTVSHELKTPLTSIVAFSDILARNPEANFTERQAKHVDVIRRNGQRLKILIEDLLDVSRIESGEFAMEIGKIDVQSVLEETLESFVPIFDSRDQTLVVDASAGNFTIDGDSARIAQVISNLASNASKYSPEGSAILVAVCDLGHEVEITVRDHGIGVSEEDLKKLFTPFFRAENKETRSVSGTGLGLVIVKSIVEAHSGVVKIETSPEAGTEVRVTFARQLADERPNVEGGHAVLPENGRIAS